MLKVVQAGKRMGRGWTFVAMFSWFKTHTAFKSLTLYLPAAGLSCRLCALQTAEPKEQQLGVIKRR